MGEADLVILDSRLSPRKGWRGNLDNDLKSLEKYRNVQIVL